MELWVPITIGAAFLQNLRSALQKHLTGQLSTVGATAARFVYAAPLALAYVLLLAQASGSPLPAPNAAFLGHVVLGGLLQIVATACLIRLFAMRNFAVGTALAKTEVVQAALFGLVILGERPSAAAVAAILISLLGVLLIALAPRQTRLQALAAGLLDPAALLGLAAGACFGISAVAYRAAALTLEDSGVAMAAAYTLAAVTIGQTVAILLYLGHREPGELARLFGAWRIAAWTGLAGMLGSACWFTAMTLQNAAYVRALGQVELLFTFAASYLVFGERSRRGELVGIALVAIGILLLLLGP